MNSDSPILFLDLDDVMVTSNQYFGKYHKKYDGHPFDPKCVKVLNSIIESVSGLVIVISSDWKNHFDLTKLNEIFEINGVTAVVTDTTGSAWGTMFKSMQQLEECRAYEINKYAEEHLLTRWVAVDDLNLRIWIPENFVRCTHSSEGIKQSGVRDKILKILNKQ
jgi:hypothetical protein